MFSPEFETAVGRKPPRARRPQGFGLLEAIVAMLILGTTGLMLFAWINQNLSTATRLKEAEARAQLQLEAQSWLASLNPALEPAGERVLDELRLSWRSELVEPMHDEFDHHGNLVPRWRLGLYRVKVQAHRTERDQWVEWQQLVVGWRVRPGSEALPGERASP